MDEISLSNKENNKTTVQISGVTERICRLPKSTTYLRRLANSPKAYLVKTLVWNRQVYTVIACWLTRNQQGHRKTITGFSVSFFIVLVITKPRLAWDGWRTRSQGIDDDDRCFLTEHTSYNKNRYRCETIYHVYRFVQPTLSTSNRPMHYDKRVISILRCRSDKSSLRGKKKRFFKIVFS